MNKEPSVSLHPHFPCEGTPAHKGDCNSPLPGDVNWREVKSAVEASNSQYSEWMQRAFSDFSQNEPEMDQDRHVPKAPNSGVFSVLGDDDDLPELALDDPRRSWAV